MQVTHWYPYIGYWGEKYKYGQDYDDGRVYLSGNYTYPVTPNTPIPNVSKLKFYLWIRTQYYTSLFNRQWYIYAYTNSGWEMIKSITMPTYEDSGDSTDDQRYSASITVDIELTTKKTITKMAAVPSSRMGSSATWYATFDIEEAEITENIPDAVLSDSDYFCGIQEKRYSSLYTSPRKIEANVDGVLKTATEIMVNVNGSLVALPKMQQYNFVATAKEQAVVIPFTPSRSGRHTINASEQYAGSANESYAYFKVYDSEMNEVTTYYTTNTSLELEAGKQYKIIAIDHPYYTDLAQRVIKVYST